MSSRFLLLLLVFSSSAAIGQTVSLVSDRDNTIYNDAAGPLSNGAGNGIFCGRPLSGSIRRGLLHWDLSAIPPNATVTSVQVQLSMAQSIAGATNVALHKLSADWGEGTSVAPSGGGGGAPPTTGDATWQDRFYNVTPWTTQGGDFVATASAQTSVNAVGNYSWGSTAALVADVQSWIGSPGANFGWILIGQETGGTPSSKRFESRESPTPANRPKLVVAYTVAAASTAVLGTGCVGVSGQPFTLGAVGVPSVPNPNFALTLANGQPSSPAAYFYLASGAAASPVPAGNGCFIFIDPTSALLFMQLALSPIGPFPLNGAGALTLPVPIGAIPSLSGARLDLQALAVDGSGVVLSNGLTLFFL